MADTPVPDSLSESCLSRWGRVLGERGAERVEAFRELAASYWYCVYAWWRRAGLEPVDADTGTLACFTLWMERAPPETSDSGAARMREWIPARLAELARDEVELIRPAAIEIDAEWAERRYADEPAGDADAIFQRRWAISVIEFTAATLQTEYAARGEEDLFAELLAFAGFGTGDDSRYQSAATRLGHTVGAMHKAVFDFRTRQREVLRSFAADTLLDPADAESEITALLCAWSAPGMEAAEAPLPSAIQSLRPDEVLARAMQSVRMTHAGEGPWQPPSVAEAAQLFPQYEVDSLVGRGGMGAVYKARQLDLDRFVAIKLLPLEVSVAQDFAERFRREARAMAKLNHPNIIAVHEFGATSEGHLFFVMDYVEGENLQEMIHGAGVAPLEALSIIGRVCDALAFAHGKGVVHRDIKPANILVTTDGQVKVADFGLARLTDSAAEQTARTMTGMIVGTTDYMAPEQMHGSSVDQRADIYSLGVTLYEMLCREVPRGVFDPPSRRVPGVTVRVDQLVIKAMQQQPDRRYQSTPEMKSDVTAASSTLVSPRPRGAHMLPRPASMPVMSAKKSRAPYWIAIFLLLAAGAAVSYLMNQKKSAAPTEAEGSEKAQVAKNPAVETPGKTSPAPEVKPGSHPSADQKVSAASDASTAVKEAPVKPADAPAPDKVPAAPATPTPKSEIATRLEQIDAQYRARYQKEVVNPYEAGMGQIKQGYIASIDRLLKEAQKASRLDEAIALRSERLRLTEGTGIPADDADKPDTSVTGLRAWYRAQAAKLARARVQGAKVHFQPYDKELAALQARLAQSQRPEDSLLVKARREQISAEWIGGQSAWKGASKDSPFMNTLGMKFVPVPIVGGPTAGQLVLFSVWDTRVQDYEPFAKETKRKWPKPSYEQGSAHPAVEASWEDAMAFCEWLTERERKAGKLGAAESYRLPSDHEWSCAVGLGALEDAAKLPAEKTGKINNMFPWGSQWPPPKGAGNFAGEELKPAVDAGQAMSAKTVIQGYTDDFVNTSPVGSFPPNQFGLYDLSGNVWQWCADLYANGQADHVVRGGCWSYEAPALLLSSRRGHGAPTLQNINGGFRCVLGASLPPSAAAAAPMTPASAPATGEWEDLLAKLTPADVEKTGHGWSLKNGELFSPTQDHAVLSLPGRLSGMSYQVRVKLRNLVPKESFNLQLPVGDRMVGFFLDGFPQLGWCSSLNMVNGKRGKELPGFVDGKQVKDAAPHELEVAVRPDGAYATITTKLDDRPLYEWTGPIASLSQFNQWTTTEPGTLVIGSMADDWAVSEVKLRRMGGSLPPSVAPAPGVWTDLLAQFTPADVEKTGHGWRMESGALYSTTARFATLPLPGNFAGINYQVKVTLKQLVPHDVFQVIIPVGGQMTGFELDGFGGKYTGLNRANGKAGSTLPGVVEGKQINDSERHDLDLTIRLDGASSRITATLDTRPLYEWAGPTTALTQESKWAGTPWGALALGAVADGWVVYDVKAKRLEE